MSEKPRPILDQLPTQPTEKQFREIVSQRMNSEEYSKLGEDAIETVSDALIYLGVFDSEPASFDIDAVISVTRLDKEKASISMNFGVRVGLLKQVGDRYLVTKQAKDIFYSLLS